MPPTRAWGLTRQNYNVMNRIDLWTILRNEMAQDFAYAGNVPNIDMVILLMTDLLALLDAHLAAEGK